MTSLPFLIVGHDLSHLAGYDLAQAPDVQASGADMVCKVQQLMQTYFSHSDTGPKLPEDQIQSIIVGVSF